MVAQNAPDNVARASRSADDQRLAYPNGLPEPSDWNVFCIHCEAVWRVPAPARPLIPDATRRAACPHCGTLHSISFDADGHLFAFADIDDERGTGTNGALVVEPPPL